MNESLINEIRHRYTEGFSIHDIMLHYGIMEAEVVAIIRVVSPLSNVRIPVKMRRKAYRPLILGVHLFAHVRETAHLCLRKNTLKEEDKQRTEYNGGDDSN